MVVKKLLPFQLTNETENNEEEKRYDYLIEPSGLDSIEKLMQEKIYLSIYKAILEGQAAEQGARMAAMDAATDNAAEMIDQLTLLYNRTRQAQITTELSEIVAGANALN